MQRLFTLVLVVCLWLGFAPAASADVAGLVPCKDSAAFNERLDLRVQDLEKRLDLYKAGSTPAEALKGQIANTQRRFDGYSNLLCGAEGLPHLITDGRLDHAGEFVLPGLLFLYLAGWLGWAGRSYLMVTRKSDQPEYNEIQINVPLAIKSFATALLWPLAAVKETLTGELQEKDSNITVSPR